MVLGSQPHATSDKFAVSAGGDRHHHRQKPHAQSARRTIRRFRTEHWCCDHRADGAEKRLEMYELHRSKRGHQLPILVNSTDLGLVTVLGAPPDMRRRDYGSRRLQVRPSPTGIGR